MIHSKTSPMASYLKSPTLMARKGIHRGRFPLVLNTNCSRTHINFPSSHLHTASSSVKMVKSLPFGDNQVPIPGFGAMGLNAMMGTNLSYEEAEPVLEKAIELGSTFWDTAVHQMKTGFIERVRF